MGMGVVPAQSRKPVRRVFIFHVFFLRSLSDSCFFLGIFLGKSKRGLTKGGLSPKFSEKIGQKSFQENRAFSGLIGAFSGPIGAFLGTDSSAPHSRGEAAEIPPKQPFWAQLAPFGLSPRLLSPRLDFPNLLHFLYRVRIADFENPTDRLLGESKSTV